MIFEDTIFEDNVFEDMYMHCYLGYNVYVIYPNMFESLRFFEEKISE